MNSNSSFYNPSGSLRPRHEMDSRPRPSPSRPFASTHVPHQRHATPAQQAHPLVQRITAQPEKIAAVFADINAMPVDELSRTLDDLGLNSGGSRQRNLKRLKLFIKKQRMAAMSSARERWYDYVVVIDFECTCEDEVFDYFHEIIEFPAVLLRTADGEVVDEFHEYVRPKLHPVLDPFCTRLTGVTQKQVENGLPFLETVENFKLWLLSHGCGIDKTYALVTDGPWDFAKFFQMTCIVNGLEAPPHDFRHWINIRRSYTNIYTNSHATRRIGGGVKEWKNLEGMLAAFGMTFEGRPHSGIDDSRNAARIVRRILEDGHELRVNERLLRRANADARLDKRQAEAEQLRRNEMEQEGRGGMKEWLESQRLREQEKDKRMAGMSTEDKDRQIWRDTLPYKLVPVARQEFLLDLYLECETCESSPESDEEPHA